MRAWLLFLLTGVLLGSFSALFLRGRLCPKQQLDVVQWDEGGAYEPGFLLVSPFHFLSNFKQPGEVFLIDEKGETVHTWKTRYTAYASYLQPNGNLIVAEVPPIDCLAFPGGGSTGLIEELDWSGQLLWEYSDPNMNHDFEPLPNGRIAYLRWRKTSPLFARSVRGGMAVPRNEIENVWSTEVVVINRSKQIEWTWRPDEHLDPKNYVLSSLTPRKDWAHGNSLRYIAANPLTHRPAFLISFRNISQVVLVDAVSGALIWKSPAGLFSYQHDATFTGDGNVLVFDNGFARANPQEHLASSVVEINPKDNKIVWRFDGGSSFMSKIHFASSLFGGAQRLENGNTLISAPLSYLHFEVDRNGQTVWRYRNPFKDSLGARTWFRTRKYSGENTSWRAWVPRKEFRISELLCR